MHFITKFWIIGLILFLSNGLKATDITILTTTDIHGHMTDDRSGMIKLASVIIKERNKAGADRTLLLDCGDTIEGSFAAYSTDGEIVIKAMNFLNYDVWVLGNHEFDLNLKELSGRINQFKGITLAANLNCKALTEKSKVLPWAIFKLKKLKIAVIGMSMPGICWQVWRRPGIIKTVDMSEALHQIMPAVRKQKPDIIILAQHLGMYSKNYNVYSLLAEFPEIDLVIGGHTHVEKSGEKVGPKSWYVQAGKHAECMARIDISYNEKVRKISRITSEIIQVDDNTPNCIELSNILKYDLTGMKRKEERILTSINQRKAVSIKKTKTIIAAMQQEAAELGKNVDVILYSKRKKEGIAKKRIDIYRKTVFDWHRFHDKVCIVEFSDVVILKRIICEFKRGVASKKITPIVIMKNTSALMSSYILAGANGRLSQMHRYGVKYPERIKCGASIQEAVVTYLKNKAKSKKQ
ncbi:MAG: bifunctional metallophosphatase/5'-nucleotidase [Lentisphaerae bacterium]|nr:bifunctional metallophosphatase/5'-nucleotidase [Lentisphaerota bacterium]MCP4101856.1 bifunctional metallophosphatase/5'-nucleotidase [Lentisphaerota bacterium]